MTTTSTNLRIGFVGLGKMGLPMARRILAAGHDVRALDSDPARLAALPGAASGSSLPELAAWAEVVVTSLPDDSALRAVALGPQGLLAHLAPGTVLVDTSTVSPSLSAEIRRGQHGADRYLAAVVSGNNEAAAAGLLTSFCSGPREAFARARPVLECFVRSATLVGGAEEARVLKLAINHFIGSAAQITAEAFTLARKGGVGWTTLLDAFESSAAAIPLLAHKAGPLRRRDFTPTFTATQMLKDMTLLVEAGDELGVDMPVAHVVRDRFAGQAAGELAQLDFFAALLERERLAGLGEPEELG